MTIRLSVMFKLAVSLPGFHELPLPGTRRDYHPRKHQGFYRVSMGAITLRGNDNSGNDYAEATDKKLYSILDGWI